MATTQTQPAPLDPQVVNLAKAIRQTESGGNYSATSKDGSYGAYQFLQSTWNNTAQKYGISASWKDATPEQQNAVAYNQIKEWKDAGHNVAQIASMWNAGQGNPNAYTGTFANGKPAVGTNSAGVKYSVPDYAYKVANAYQTYKKQSGDTSGDTAYASGGQDTPQAATPPQAPSVGGFLGNVASSAGNLLGGLGNAVMHPIDTVTNLASTVAGAGESATNALGLTHVNNQDTQNFHNLVSTYGQKYGGSSIGEVVHNIGHTLYTDPVGAALDLSTVLDGAGAALGAAGKIADAGKVMTAEQAANLAKTTDFISTANGILKSSDPAAIKALATPGTMTKIADAVKTAAQYTNPVAPVANAISGTFNKLSDLTQAIPRRIINNLLPQLKNPETIDYATSNLKLGSVDSMITKSESSLDAYDTSIKSILNHPDYQGVAIKGSDIIQKTLQEFPNSEYTPQAILDKIKSQIPGTAALVTKLQDSGLSLMEANTLRQAIDRITYKNIIDSPEVRAGKELAEAFGNSLRNTIKDTAPETKPIFSNYRKEINLRRALDNLSKKQGRASAISMREMVGALGATGIAGPIAGVGMLAAEKLADTPAVRVGTARLLSKTAVPTAKAVAKGVTKTAPFLKEAAMAQRVNSASQTNQ